VKAYLLLLAVMFGTLAVAASADVIYVDWDGSGDHETIQEAVDAAGQGDTLLVAAGTYSGPLNRDIMFYGKNLYLYSESGPGMAVIDCQNAGRAFEITGGETPALTIEGFEVRNGYAPVGEGGDRWGGAIFCAYSGCSIVKCSFVDCSSDYGGAMYCGISAVITIVSSEFSGNDATSYGGSIYCYAADVDVAKCTFTDCEAGISGGGLCAKTGTLIEISDCDFVECSAPDGGGVYVGTFDNGGTEPESPSLVRYCTFTRNDASRGGGLFINGFTWLNAQFCDFEHNTAQSYGGGIYALTDYTRSLTVQNCTFVFNGSEHGGGVFAAGVFGFQMSVNQSIFAFGTGGGTIQAEDYGTVFPNYCVAYGNTGGDSVPGPGTTNLQVDPLFCDVMNGDYYLCDNSPCLASINPYGFSVGAHVSEWTTCDSCPSPVEEVSWGAIKAMYR